ncbi:MAG: hypothetical protein ACYTEL_07470 [Planctomycetota bacterium]|jgi:hypothetical protein
MRMALQTTEAHVLGATTNLNSDELTFAAGRRISLAVICLRIHPQSSAAISA